MVTHARIIEQLGGRGPVADLLHRNRSTLSRWANHGIPPHAWPVILKLAHQRGITLDLEQLAASSPRYGRRGTNRYRFPTIRKGAAPASATL